MLKGVMYFRVMHKAISRNMNIFGVFIYSRI